jgi:hypothetical protein
MSTTGQVRLTRWIKRFLDIAWFFSIAVAILGPILFMAAAFSLTDQQQFRAVNVSLRFLVESGSTVAAGADRILGGEGTVVVKTRSLFAWYLTASIGEAMILAWLYGIAQMRRIFASLARGESFAADNAARINRVGWLLIGWNVLLPIVRYVGGSAVLNDLVLDPGQSIVLKPAFEYSLTGVIVGLAIIVLAGVLREAAIIHHEQSLTI